MNLDKDEKQRLIGILHRQMQSDIERENPYFIQYVEKYQKRVNKDCEILKKLGRSVLELSERAKRVFNESESE